MAAAAAQAGPEPEPRQVAYLAMVGAAPSPAASDCWQSVRLPPTAPPDLLQAAQRRLAFASVTIQGSSPPPTVSVVADLVEAVGREVRGVEYPRREPTASSLVAAAEAADEKEVQLLLAAGVDIDAVSASGATALQVAVKRNGAAMVELLVKAGADVELADADTSFPPLLVAAGSGYSEVISVLLEAGADWTRQTGGTGETALDWARLRGKHDAAAALERWAVAAGAPPQPRQNPGPDEAGGWVGVWS